MLILLLNPKITVIIEDSLVFTVQQVSGEHHVVDVGCHGVDSVDQPESVISAELPLTPFLGLMHFRISLALNIFGGAGRRNDDGVHNAVIGQHQAILLQLLLGNHCLKSFQKRFAAGFAILSLVLGLGEGGLMIHSGTGSYSVDGAPIIANFETYSESLYLFILPARKIRMNYFSKKKGSLIQPIIPVKRRKILQ
jgi:hypothetical protein